MSWVLPVLIFSTVLGAFVYVRLPSSTWRLIGTIAYVLLVVVVWGGTFELLGRPKNISLEWRKLAGSEIVSFVPVENVAIYVWVLRDGIPMTYVLPWSAKDAQAMQDGLKRMSDGGGDLQLSGNIDGTPDSPGNGEITKTLPPKSLPPKS